MKMSFNPDPSKQAEEVTFNGLLTKYIIYPFLFVNSVVQQISTQNYLGIHLDEELTFKHHINEKRNKANKGIGFICKLNNIIPCSVLLGIHRSFV